MRQYDILGWHDIQKAFRDTLLNYMCACNILKFQYYSFENFKINP
jgi:hypothetical protein